MIMILMIMKIMKMILMKSNDINVIINDYY